MIKRPIRGIKIDRDPNAETAAFRECHGQDLREIARRALEQFRLSPAQRREWLAVLKSAESWRH